jgi:hypothetical protein
MTEEELQKLKQRAEEAARDELLYAEHLWQQGYLRGLLYAVAVCGTTRPLPEWAADGLTLVLHELDIGKEGVKYEVDCGRERIKYGGRAFREKSRKHDKRWDMVKRLRKEGVKWDAVYQEAAKRLSDSDHSAGADAVRKSYQRINRIRKSYQQMKSRSQKGTSPSE